MGLLTPEVLVLKFPRARNVSRIALALAGWAVQSPSCIQNGRQQKIYVKPDPEVTSGLHCILMHASTSMVSHRSHLSWPVFSCNRRRCCRPWIQSPKGSKICQNFQRRWLSPRSLQEDSSEPPAVITVEAMLLCSSERRIYLTQGSSTMARRRGHLQCSPQPAAMEQSLDERQISDVLYHPGHITDWEPLMVGTFKGTFKASTSLLLSMRSMRGKSSRPLK